MIWEGRESFNQDYSYRRNTQTLILMLIFPVIAIFMCNFFITYRGNVLSAKDSLRIESEKKLELLYTNLSPMYQLTDTRRKDRFFSTKYLQDVHFMDAFFNIKRSLQRDSVWVSFLTVSAITIVRRRRCSHTAVSAARRIFLAGIRVMKCCIRFPP